MTEFVIGFIAWFLIGTLFHVMRYKILEQSPYGWFEIGYSIGLWPVTAVSLTDHIVRKRLRGEE
jgi:hypothetical protein